MMYTIPDLLKPRTIYIGYVGFVTAAFVKGESEAA